MWYCDGGIVGGVSGSMELMWYCDDDTDGDVYGSLELIGIWWSCLGPGWSADLSLVPQRLCWYLDDGRVEPGRGSAGGCFGLWAQWLWLCDWRQRWWRSYIVLHCCLLCCWYLLYSTSRLTCVFVNTCDEPNIGEQILQVSDVTRRAMDGCETRIGRLRS